MSTGDTMTTDLMRLTRLKAHRLRAALSQRDLAARAGVTHATIVRLERGEDAYPSTARKLAEALGVKPYELMDPAEIDQP